MFTPDFFPTHKSVIELMLMGESFEGKIVFEPHGGKGDIVDYLWEYGAGEVLACEKHPDLKKILATKCKVIGSDFLKIQAHEISHIDFIVMNPPFIDGVEHIIHAFNIAPSGCRIIALCNSSNIKNVYCESRKQLKQIIDENGSSEDLGKCFADAERMTHVEISLIKLTKPGENYNQEFEGFFLDEEPEEQANALISYDVIRDIVNRYVGALKVFDEQLISAIKMQELTSGFFNSDIATVCTKNGAPVRRNDYKKDLQKNAWNFIFRKLDMQKYATRGLIEDINKFVEKQSHIPFTMKNIYKMLEIVIGTHESRINRAILEVFDKVTAHHDENRYHVEGWKTNSWYLLTKKFIHPGLFSIGWSGQMSVSYSSEKVGLIDDLHKALCFVTADNYDEIGSFSSFTNSDSHKTFNTWYEFGMFRVKGFKKGTAHFEFKDEKVWALFNQRVAKLKGYPLFEGKKTTAWQDRQWGRTKPTEKPKEKPKPKKENQSTYKQTVLGTFKIAH